MTAAFAGILCQLFVAYNQDDQDTLWHLLAEDVVYHMPGRNLFAGDYQGRRAVLDLWAFLPLSARPLLPLTSRMLLDGIRADSGGPKTYTVHIREVTGSSPVAPTLSLITAPAEPNLARLYPTKPGRVFDFGT